MILGKPHTPDRAIGMLKTLSGRTHTVVSGVCICYKGKTMSFSQKTLVSFYELFEEEIRDYVQSCKPLDKAGAYGIQDKGGLFVREISGDYYNIVGLPVARLKREIDKLVSICERE